MTDDAPGTGGDPADHERSSGHLLEPFEARAALIVPNTAAVTVGPVRFEAMGVGATAFDVAGAAVALGMVGLLSFRAAADLRRLSRLEPPPGP